MSEIFREAGPLLVAVLTAVVMMFTQPIGGEILGFPGNLFATGTVVIGGITATLS